MTLNLPDQLTIAKASALREEWLQTLDSSEDAEDASVVIDAQATSKVDATGMTLLLSLFLELDSRKKSWSWSEIPAVIADAAADMGVAHQLQPRAD